MQGIIAILRQNPEIDAAGFGRPNPSRYLGSKKLEHKKGWMLAEIRPHPALSK
jgi:hypothetical protein